MRFLERGEQEVPRTPEQLDPLAYSSALHGLEAFAPAFPIDYDLDDVDYPFSNDESQGYYIQLQARTQQADYRLATNRTAIIIGEGALMSALPHIPEETIILLDSSPAMLGFMKGYVEALRGAGSVEEWGDMMGLRGAELGSAQNWAAGSFIRQMNERRKDGFAVPFEDPALFFAAREQARQKAIIPWQGDITDRWSMYILGQVLKDHEANVTFLNLSNVLPHDDNFDRAEDYADRLRALPVAQYAPIMTSSTRPVWDYDESEWRRIVGATGPFFGLDNLVRHGGSLDFDHLGAAGERQYFAGQQEPPEPYPFMFTSDYKEKSAWPAE